MSGRRAKILKLRTIEYFGAQEWTRYKYFGKTRVNAGLGGLYRKAKKVWSSRRGPK